MTSLKAASATSYFVLHFGDVCNSQLWHNALFPAIAWKVYGVTGSVVLKLLVICLLLVLSGL